VNESKGANDEIIIAQIGNGATAVNRVSKVLKEANIGYALEGSVAIDIAVNRRDANRARELLRKEFYQGELGFHTFE
jgi:hypothetical protein